MANQVLKKERILSIDLLRGLCVLFLVLHTRYFIEFVNLEGLFWDQIYQESLSFFFLRFISHPVSPIFLFLAGMSIFLYMKRRDIKKRELSRYLLVRGSYLVLIDMFIISFLWNFTYDTIFLQVLTSIGISFILFSFLLYLPKVILLILSLSFIFLQDFLSSYLSQFKLPPLLEIFISNTSFSYFGIQFLYLFPILISVLVLCLGFVFGSQIFSFSKKKRKELFFLLSLSFLSFFVILRFFNIYGDSHSWSFGASFIQSLLSFLSITKYPYSLQFLLFSGSIAFYFLFLFEHVKSISKNNILLVFGRSPLFFYVSHLFVIHFFIFFFEFLFQKSVFTFFELFIFFFFVLSTMYPLCLFYQHLKKNYFSQKRNPFKALKRILKQNERSTRRNKSS